MGVTDSRQERRARYVILVPVAAQALPVGLVLTFMASAAVNAGLDVSVDLIGPRGIDRALVARRAQDGVTLMVFHDITDAEMQVLQQTGADVLFPLSDPATAVYRAAAAINAALGRAEAQRLITYGRTHLAFVAPQESPYQALVQLRYAGVLQTCLAAGVAAPALVSIPADLAVMARQFVIQGQGENGFDGYACHDDIAAIRTTAALRMIGRMVPYDGSVIGVGDSEACALVNPAITSIAMDYQTVGNALSGGLVATLTGGEYAAPGADAMDALLHVASRDSA